MPNGTQQLCPICDTALSGYQAHLNSTLYTCRRCGNFIINGLNIFATGLLEAKLGDWVGQSIHLRSRLSHVIRCQQSVGYYFQVDPNQLEALRLEDSLPSPFEQSDRLIIWLGKHQPSVSESAQVPVDEVSAWIGLPILRPANNSGLGWLLAQQELTPLLEQRGDQGGKILLRLKMAGWARYEELTKQHVESRIAFMATKFDEEVFKVIDNCFKPAVAKTGFDLRVLTDGQPAGLIDDQIRVALRRAKFVIADLTHGNQGAYWEAGFAEGLGRPVIYTCRQAEWNQNRTHFDTNHLVTIVWNPENLADAAQRLCSTIRATLPSEAKLTDG